MSAIVFDAGPVISLTMNNLLWIIAPLRRKFAGSFVIPQSVQQELVDTPLESKKFKFEALQARELIMNGTLEVLPEARTKDLTLQLTELANNAYTAKGHPVQLVHRGEVAVLAAAKLLQADAVVMDERTTREMVEHPQHLAQIMRHRLHTKVSVDRQRMQKLQEQVKGIRIIRSAELVAAAYELGLLDRYISGRSELRRTLLESVLWGVKLDGCALSTKEIEDIMRMEKV